MGRKLTDETVERSYAAHVAPPQLCLSVACEGRGAFVVELPDGTVTVGRGAEANLLVGSPSLSRQHFALEVRGERLLVRDLGSRNGTHVDGHAIADTPLPLGVGAELVAGDGRFTVLRRSALPDAGPALSLLGPFELALFSASPPLPAVSVFALRDPLGTSRELRDLLPGLPQGALFGLISDTVVLVASADASALDGLSAALAERDVLRASAHARGAEASSAEVVRRLQETLVEGHTAAPAAPEGDVPEPFRFPSLRRVHDELRRFGPRAISVLLTGETGTGKEVVARELHRLSGRPGALVAVNTAALPEALIESELFGHERGAFSGAATAKAGLVEASDRGTLFLDEIGELPLSMQAKLLRVLEERTVRRVGSTTERKLDLRVIAATHQDLEALVREKRFRADLLYRLNGATVRLPPLRERAGELGPLARLVLRELGAPAPYIDGAAIGALEGHPFPGNVRELRNVLERALAFADGGIVRAEHLPEGLALPPSEGSPEAPEGGRDVRATVRDFERERIIAALRESGGNRTRAAELLGLPRRTLVYKLSKLGITEA